MAEELKNRGFGESELIDVTDQTQCEHWSGRVGVSTAELQRVVRGRGTGGGRTRLFLEPREPHELIAARAPPRIAPAAAPARVARDSAREQDCGCMPIREEYTCSSAWLWSVSA